MKKLLGTLRSITLPVWIGVNVLIAGLTVFSGYASHIDQEYMPLAGVVAMSFPLWYLLSAVCLVANLFACRWLSVVSLATLLIALKPLLIFSPLNFQQRELTEDQQQKSFKLLSYNILNFVDAEGKSTPEFNRTIHTLIHCDADALALMEYPLTTQAAKIVPQAQLDSLHAAYPYFSRGGRGTVLFSRRPILHIVPPDNMPSKGSIEVFRTQVQDRPLNIVAVHLESFGLNDKDKELYRDLAEVSDIEKENKKETLNKVRDQLVSKLLFAFKSRAWQGKMLRTFVEQLPDDVVVCGDFNDVPGCRTVKILNEIGMKDAYAETALGPTVTFNAPNFKFRIDHVLYRGRLKAVSVQRGDQTSSDHYPMLSTFIWE